MSSRTVQNVVTYPGTSSPIPGRTISIQLNVPGFSNSGSTEILSTRVIQADDTGLWSVDLTPNSEIDPAGTYYTAREIRGGTIWPFIVTAGSGAVNLRDCLVSDPTNPNPLAAGVQSVVAGTNVTVDDTDPSNPVVSATGGGGGAVSSVNGHTGAVVLTASDVGADDAGAAASAQTAAQTYAAAQVAAEATARATAISAAIAGLIASAPGALDTLNELAAALGDDPNYAATITAALAGKLAKASNLSDVANAATALANLGGINGSFNPTGTDLTSTTLAAAIAELDVAIAAAIGTAVTQARNGVLLATDQSLLVGRGNYYSGAEQTLDRAGGMSGNFNATAGVVFWGFFTAQQFRSVSNLKVFTAGTAGSPAPTLARLGLYSVNATTGDLALLAGSVNDTTLFTAASTAYSKGVTAQNLVKGQRYAVGLLQVGSTTAPKVYGQVTVGAINSDPPMIAAQLAGQTDLPSTVAAASLAATTGMPFAAVY